MLKTSLNYIMSILLLVSIIGISINKHYSGKELYSVSIFSEPDSCCDEPCDCCNETTEVFQITDVFLLSNFYLKQTVKIINLNYGFNSQRVKLFFKEAIYYSFNFYKLKYSVLQTQAQLQCFIL